MILGNTDKGRYSQLDPLLDYENVQQRKEKVKPPTH
jgi:hypothetical protein